MSEANDLLSKSLSVRPTFEIMVLAALDSKIQELPLCIVDL